MKRMISLLLFPLFLGLMLGIVPINVPSQEKPQKKGRESVLDSKVHVEKELVLEIPQVPRWCDCLDLKKQRVNIGSCELYVEEEGKGIPVVLLHGGPGATHHYFHPHLSRAKDFVRIIYYDQRGCGLSDYKKGAGYTVDQAVDDLENLRKALKIEKWVLFGHSYGGVLSQCYSVKYPERVAGIMLVGSGLAMRIPLNPTRQYDYISKKDREAMWKFRMQIRKLYLEKKFSRQHLIELVLFNNFLNGDWKRQNFYRPSRERVAQKALYEWKHDTNFNEVMSQEEEKVHLKGAFEGCPIPRLIIEGRWDLTWNTDKPDKLHRNHPGSRLVMFERSSHNPFEDEPEKFFKLMREFVQTLPNISDSDISRWKEFLVGWKEKMEVFPLF